MFRALLRTVFWVFCGILAGQIPLQGTTLGRAAWKHTREACTWSGGRLQSLVSHAGVGEAAWMKWARRTEKPKPVERDPEGLTPLDKEALRQILE